MNSNLDFKLENFLDSMNNSNNSENILNSSFGIKNIEKTINNISTMNRDVHIVKLNKSIKLNINK